VTLFLLICGLAFLLAGGVALVTGASAIATRLGVPPLVVGLTVLAFGTSSPELVVNIIGAVRGETELAFGNVAGSNLANLGLVLGMAAAFRPVSIHGTVVRRELPLLLLGTTILVVMMLDRPLMGEAPILTRSDGLILLLLFSVFVYITAGDLLFKDEDALINDVRELEETLPRGAVMTMRQGALYCGLGIIGLGLGGHLTIVYGSEFATDLGVSPVVVGILVVGIGTSLPELVTSIIAAIRNECDLCVGNVVGSNIFNSLVVLPVSALVRPLPIPPGGLLDVVIGLLFAAIIIPIFLYGKARMDRYTGVVFILVYAGYVGMRATA